MTGRTHLAFPSVNPMRFLSPQNGWLTASVARAYRASDCPKRVVNFVWRGGRVLVWRVFGHENAFALVMLRRSASAVPKLNQLQGKRQRPNAAARQHASVGWV